MHADSTLIQRAQAHDRAAFNEIVLRYKSKIYNYIFRMVRSASDADDLTQETFIRAYMSIHTFQSRASLNTWLFRIATNLCVDYSRKSKTHPVPQSLSTSQEEEQSAPQEIPSLAFEPQRLLLNRELGRRLEEALRQLPERLRTVVILYDLEGLSYEEIAQIVGTPLGTVKSRLYHARLQLREILLPYLQDTF